MNYALFHQYRDPGLLDEDTLDRWSRFRRDIEAETPVLDDATSPTVELTYRVCVLDDKGTATTWDTVVRRLPAFTQR